MMTLEQKIKNKTAKIGVIGLGYVGLPLAVEFAYRGFQVVGIDKDPNKIDKIKKGQNYIDDVADEKFHFAVEKKRFSATSSYRNISNLDVIFICVPTPFSPTKDPDISFIESATEGIAAGLRKNQLIILKSTTFPETTEKCVKPILEKTGLKVGKDFFLAFSPERIDPGNKKYDITNTPLVVGGITKKCTQLACLVNQQITVKVIAVSSPAVAEMEKLLENIFRSVNIALVNEIARLCDRMGNINIWEVIAAAATKPFGFMPFYPGPGIGGHCILVDPYYLSWKAREYDFHSNFIELAAETNENMPFYVLNLVLRALNDQGKSLKKAKILVLGAAFKKNVDDIRNSPALKVMELLKFHGVREINYNDPYVPQIHLQNTLLKSKPLTPQLLKSVDCVLIATDHSAYDYPALVQNSQLIVDTRNATHGVTIHKKHVYVLGSGLGETYANRPERH